MRYNITVEADFVRAEVVGRETVEETKDFLRTVARYSATHSAFLFAVRASKPIFRLERQGLIERFKEVARSPGHKIALLADDTELRISHDYLELISLQYALNIRSFRTAAEALQWLRAKP